jgi:DNA-binding transcriptional MerR regulator
MTEEKSYTISELAEAAEVTIRTIRYYVAEDVLPPPLGSSRASIYTEEHLNRLRLIKILKEEFLPLQEIRALLSGLDQAAVLELLAQREREEVPSPSTSAKDYLKTLLVSPASAAEAPALMRHKVESHQARSSTPVDNQLQRSPLPLPAKEEALAPGFAESKRLPPEPEVGGDLWQRIELAPGVELHVEAAAVAPSLRSKIEQLVKVARQLLRSNNA